MKIIIYNSLRLIDKGDAYFEILERLCLLFWVLWAWMAMSTKIDNTNLLETLKFICMQKTNFIPPFFLEILQWYSKLIILSTWPIPDYGQQKDKISLKKTLMVVFMQKSNLSLTFLEILLRYRNLFRSFRYDWPCPLKLIIPACMKVW